MSELEPLEKWPSIFAPRFDLRGMLAGLLVRASSALARIAASLASEPALPRGEPLIEFHAEAGAPEGALYLDGKLVGWISGISRL